jgi:methylthioribose-1-phosphate isomerase
LEFRGIPTTLPGVQGLYPAFDRTPGRLVTGVVTDRGVFAPTALADYFTDTDDDFPGA